MDDPGDDPGLLSWSCLRGQVLMILRIMISVQYDLLSHHQAGAEQAVSMVGCPLGYGFDTCWPPISRGTEGAAFPSLLAPLRPDGRYNSGLLSSVDTAHRAAQL